MNLGSSITISPNYTLHRSNGSAFQNWRWLSVIIVDVWNTTSFVALMLLAGLQSLPEEPFEAAHIDGASKLQAFSLSYSSAVAPSRSWWLCSGG